MTGGTKHMHGGLNLNFCPPIDGNLIKIEKTEAGMEKWRNAVTCFMLGYPTYFAIKRFTEKRWKEFGEVEVISLKNGMYVFNFQTEQGRNKVLEKSPWPIGSKMIFFKLWFSEIDLRKDDLSPVPVWIRLPNLKLH